VCGKHQKDQKEAAEETAAAILNRANSSLKGLFKSWMSDAAWLNATSHGKRFMNFLMELFVYYMAGVIVLALLFECCCPHYCTASKVRADSISYQAIHDTPDPDHDEDQDQNEEYLEEQGGEADSAEDLSPATGARVIAVLTEPPVLLDEEI
jgi:hypothetical protein